MLPFFTETFLKKIKIFFFFKIKLFDQKAIVTLQMSAHGCTGFGQDRVNFLHSTW